MSTTKTINITNNVHQIDDQGARKGWGERYHDLQIDVVDALNSISGSSDISEQSFNLSAGASNAILTGMVFDLSNYIGSDAFMSVVEYSIKKTYDGPSIIAESGTMTCTFDGSNFDFVRDSIGDDSEIDITFNSAGQALYTDNSVGHTGITQFFIRFKARSASTL